MFFFNKPKKGHKVKVEMRGYVNGKEVKLPKSKPYAKIPSMDYYQTLQREIKPLENKLVELATAHRKLRTSNDKINSLKHIIATFNALKSKCASLGPDFQDYFSEMWEHCHNSRNPNFCYIDPYKKELAELMSKL